MIYIKTSRNFRIILAIVIAIIVFSVVFQFLYSGRPVLSAIDEYGCLTPAGYAWNKYVGACIRGFELSKTQRAVAKIAVEDIGQAKGLSVTAVEKGEGCVGCFVVKTVVAGSDKIEIINIENWAIVDLSEQPAIGIDEAIRIAEASDCMNDGELMDEYMYNENSKTWWINMTTEKENCYPACVVYTENKTAEINWRCMGVLENESPDFVN